MLLFPPSLGRPMNTGDTFTPRGWEAIPSDVSRFASVKTSGNQSTSSTTLANITGLVLNVNANSTGYFNFYVPFFSSGLLSGIKIAPSFGAVTSFSARARAPVALNSASGEVTTSMNASGDTLQTSAVISTSTPYAAIIEGYIKTAGAARTLQIQYASSSALATVTIAGPAIGTLWYV